MDDVQTRLKSASWSVAVPRDAFERMVQRRERVRRRQRRASIVVAALIAIGVVGGAVTLLAGLGRGSERIGDTWQPAKRLQLGPGEYFYLRIESSDLGDGQIRDEETWWGPDGSGEVRSGSTRPDKYPYPPEGTYGAGEFPIWIPDVSSLSTDGAVLASQLREGPWDWRDLLLETPYAIPELRAAVFEVASHLDGVTVVESDLDPVGRPSISLVATDAEKGATWTTYFDPGTHQAIAWTFRSTRGGYVWQLLESGIVDTAGERPRGAQWLVPPLSSEFPAR